MLEIKDTIQERFGLKRAFDLHRDKSFEQIPDKEKDKLLARGEPCLLRQVHRSLLPVINRLDDIEFEID